MIATFHTDWLTGTSHLTSLKFSYQQINQPVLIKVVNSVMIATFHTDWLIGTNH